MKTDCYWSKVAGHSNIILIISSRSIAYITQVYLLLLPLLFPDNNSLLIYFSVLKSKHQHENLSFYDRSPRLIAIINA